MQGTKLLCLFGISIKLIEGCVLISPCLAPVPQELKPPNDFTDPTITLPTSARGARLSRRDLGFFHVLSQSRQTNPAGSSYKFGIVNISC